MNRFASFLVETGVSMLQTAVTTDSLRTSKPTTATQGRCGFVRRRSSFDKERYLCYNQAMFGRRFFRILCVAALGLALFDSFADASGRGDSKAAAAVCHTCSCGTHAEPKRVVEVVTIAVPPAVYSAYQPPVYAFLPPDSTFHPPRLAA